MNKSQTDYGFIERMHDRHYESLVRYVAGFTGEVEAARDIVNDAFLELWHNRARIDPEGPVRSYLFRTSRNKSLNYIKHKRVELKNREYLTLQIEDFQALDETAENYEVHIERLRRALLNLPESQREVITLICIEGMMQKEVARSMNISVNTVKTHLLRGMKSLKADMKKIYLFFI